MLQLRKTKKVFANFPRGFWRFPTKFQRFKKKCCPRAEDRAIFDVLRLRGKGQGLEASRPRPRTSKCVLEDVLVAKDVLEDSISAKSFRMITLTCFQLKWLERLILYHINEDNNVQAKLSASQYGFHAGVSISSFVILYEFFVKNFFINGGARLAGRVEACSLG